MPSSPKTFKISGLTNSNGDAVTVNVNQLYIARSGSVYGTDLKGVNLGRLDNPFEIDLLDGDDIGDACDPCNDLAFVLGNINGDASGEDYIPIIDVADVLAFSDLLNNTGLPPNDCQQVDLLEDGTINDWDLLVLVEMVMNGGN